MMVLLGAVKCGDKVRRKLGTIEVGEGNSLDGSSIKLFAWLGDPAAPEFSITKTLEAGLSLDAEENLYFEWGASDWVNAPDRSFRLDLEVEVTLAGGDGPYTVVDGVSLMVKRQAIRP